jgi:excisionase family DNA binding protein
MTPRELEALLDNPGAVEALSPAARARLQTHIAGMLVRLGGLGMALAASPGEDRGPARADVAPRLLTLHDVAQRLALSKDTVTRLVHTGELPHVKVGRRYRVTEEALRAWQRETERGGR